MQYVYVSVVLYEENELGMGLQTILHTLPYTMVNIYTHEIYV